MEGLYGFDDSAKGLNYNTPLKEEMVEEHLEHGMMPIGENCFGDIIMVGVSDNNNGQIFFYYHDRPRNYIKITDNFKDFVAVCKSHEIGHIRTIEERLQSSKEKGIEVPEIRIKCWQDEIDFYNGIHQERVIL